MEEHSRTTKKQHRYITRFIWLWVPVVAWMVIIYSLSSRHSISVSDAYLINFLFFKMLHVLEYAMLYLLLFRAIYHCSDPTQRKLGYIRAYIVTVLYAVTDELHQSFVPSRTPMPRDVIIDAIGAGIVWYYLSVHLPKAPAILKKWAKNLAIPY